MNKPKAVVFDLGKVLVDFDWRIAASGLAAQAHYAGTEIFQLFGASPLLVQYETGDLTSLQFYEEVCAATGFRGHFDEFRRIFADIFSPIEAMIAVQREIAAQGIPTFILSNTNELAVAHIRANYPFFQNFNGYVYSYEHRVMKPAERIYVVLEKMAGYRGSDLLFIDDRLENVEAAARRNWQMIHHLTPEQTQAALKSLKLLPSRPIACVK